MSSHLPWYVSRSTGLVAWALATISVLGGFALSGRFFDRRRLPPGWLADLHRRAGGLSVVFACVHVAVLLLDRTVGFTLVELLVPFASRWRPGAVAWGNAALLMLLAVQGSSLLRRRLPGVWWRRLHLLAVPMFGAGTVHLLLSGSDATHPLVTAGVLLLVSAFLLLAIFRVLVRPPRPPRRSSAATQR